MQKRMREITSFPSEGKSVVNNTQHEIYFSSVCFIIRKEGISGFEKKKKKVNVKGSEGTK